MMMYHDNLGLYLRKGNADYASWLLEGMDSSLRVVAKQFPEHRKLQDPFQKSYDKYSNLLLIKSARRLSKIIFQLQSINTGCLQKNVMNVMPIWR